MVKESFFAFQYLLHIMLLNTKDKNFFKVIVILVFNISSIRYIFLLSINITVYINRSISKSFTMKY
jgi:hypothetical protein